jgi:hypothetical protein
VLVTVLRLPVAGGTVAWVLGAAVTGAGVAPDPEDAWLAKKTENAPTSPTPMPASKRVVVEMRRMPVSRSTDRCGVTVGPLTSRTVQ